MFRLYRDDRHREIDIGIIRGDLVIPPATQGKITIEMDVDIDCPVLFMSPDSGRFYDLTDVKAVQFLRKDDPEGIPGVQELIDKLVEIVMKFPSPIGIRELELTPPMLGAERDRISPGNGDGRDVQGYPIQFHKSRLFEGEIQGIKRRFPCFKLRPRHLSHSSKGGVEIECQFPPDCRHDLTSVQHDLDLYWNGRLSLANCWSGRGNRFRIRTRGHVQHHTTDIRDACLNPPSEGVHEGSA